MNSEIIFQINHFSMAHWKPGWRPKSHTEKPKTMKFFQGTVYRTSIAYSLTKVKSYYIKIGQKHQKTL